MPPSRSLSDVLKLLYDHEINVAMSSFWDGGWLVQIGDISNGFRSSQNFRDEDFGAIPEWQLYEQWRSAMALITSADHDVSLAQRRRSEAIDRRDRYRAALEKLGADAKIFGSSSDS